MTPTKPRRTITLMVDWGCWPLWEPGGDPYPKTPDDLPLSDTLRARLRAWAETFDALLNEDDPSATDFPSDAARRQFCQEGAVLFDLLQAELGGSFDVQYNDWPCRW